MSDEKKFSELPLTSRVMAVAAGITAGALLLAVVAISAGFLWKLVLWAWS